MKKYLELIRVKHWIKNILIFIPMICAKELNYSNLLITTLGFFAFSFSSSFIYIINDLKDIEKDKLHPRKKKRPLPSGRINKNMAIFISIIMIVFSLILNFYINDSVLNLNIYILISYLIINIAYSFGLKDVAIIDIVLLASGFVLRVYYGASILNIAVSNWLFLTIMSASLFLGFGKRKKEIINNKYSRKVLKEYNEEFLDKFQYVCLSLTIIFYSLWTLEYETNILYTIPLIIIIFMRYSLIIEKNNEGDPTTIIYSDKFLLSMIFIYGIIMLLLLVI